MTLRSRLSLFFIAIVVVPLTGAAVAVSVLVPKELNERSDERLRGAASAVAAARAERLDRAARDVSRIARGLTRLPANVRAGRLAAARNESGLDFLQLGSVRVGRSPVYLDGFVPSIAPDPQGVLVASTRLPGGPLLSGGWYTDQPWAAWLAKTSGVGITIVAGDETIARSSIPLVSASGAALAGATPLPDAIRTLRLSVNDGKSALVLSAPKPHPGRSLGAALLGVGGLGLVLACLLGLMLARAIAGPLARLSGQASAIARGDYSRRVEVRGRDEVAQLGGSINSMTDAVRVYVGELKQSRDELRRTLERLGATLRSTRGMEEMLSSVLEAAAAALGAEAGALFRLQPDGSLAVEATIGLEAAQATREAASLAVFEGRPVLRPGLGGDDPLGRTVAAAPLHRDHEIVGVLAIATGAVPEPFDEQDLSTLSSFAAQASVAIDNVFLREQAEHLAMTDSLTGVPNRRALEQMLHAEIERAHRYARPVSVLMIDLDHFKSVNDKFGHLDGDRVLIEAARRIGSVVRSGVDVLARYGGEEFVLILPETTATGAITAAQKVVETMAGRPFAAAGGSTLTVSVGVACVPGDGPSESDVLHAADLALYQAKESGRNRVVATSNVERDAARSGGNR